MPLLPFSNPETGTANQAKLAVLIDADNTQAAIIEGLLNEVTKYGIASVKRIYGDWTSTHLRTCYTADSAVFVYVRKERHRQRNDYRRDGFALYGKT